MGALGIFQLEGAKDELVLGSPAVVSATIQLPGQRQAQISTVNQAEANVSVREVHWTPAGGVTRQLTDSTLKYTEFMRGGALVFTLGPTLGPDLKPATASERPSKFLGPGQPKSEADVSQAKLANSSKPKRGAALGQAAKGNKPMNKLADLSKQLK